MATAKLFLDTRMSKKDSEALATVRVAVNHRGKSSAITTEVRVTPSQWDAKNARVKNHPQKGMLNRILVERLGAVNTVLVELSVTPEALQWSASDLVKKVREALAPVKEAATPKKPELPKKPKENPDTVEKFFVRYMENKDLRPRSKEKYVCTWGRIVKWLGNKDAQRLEFSQINLSWIEAFDKYLAHGCPSANGRRIHHANLKAVINYAIDNEVIDRNPYRRYTIRTEKTKKRNLTVEQLRTIIFAQGLEPWMEKYRDFFVLSFMLRGLNTVDLCHLTKPVNGRVEWERTKTGQELSLKIEPEMQIIIEKYQGTDLMLDICDGGRNYRYFNDKLTKALHKISLFLNERDGEVIPDFTMYWARHTWATLAYKLDFSLDMVGEGLGHSQKAVTEIYIERDPAKVDHANRCVLDYVLYNKDYRVKEEPQVIEPTMKKRGRPRKTA